MVDSQLAQPIAMALTIYSSIRASGSVPPEWKPLRGGSIKYRVSNAKILTHLRSLRPGRWQKVIKRGTRGDVHYFEIRQARSRGKILSGGDMMSSMNLEPVLKGQPHVTRLPTFALLVLGIVESISSGVLSASDAARTFFTAENCLFVRHALKNRSADQIMSRGVQLPDLFDALAPYEAARELREELRSIQDLCRTLLQRTSLAA